MIVQDGLRRMYAEQEDVFYYLTVMNENYEHPAMPEGAEAGILKGMYLFRAGAGGRRTPRVQLLGSGTILREVIAAADLLAQDFGVAADIWSCPASPSSGARRWRSSAGTCFIRPSRRARATSRTCLGDREGPVVAATDYMRLFADQIRPFVPQRYRVLGTDGFGRSDYREAARLLRGRPALGRGGGARKPCSRGRTACRHRRARPSRSTASTRRSRTRPSLTLRDK